jgi:hypothetical protein
MPLPELQIPAGIKPFKASGHVRTPEPLYGPVPRQTGHSRRRRLYTEVPQMLDAEVELSQAQLEQFTAWHETALAVGSVPFAANIAKIGAGTEWWEARCLEFSVDHQQGTQHLLRLKLRLFGSPYATGPVSATMTGEAAANLVFAIGADFAYALTGEASAGLEIEVDLGPVLTGEARAGLLAEFNGGPGVNKLDGEAYAELQSFYIREPGAALAGEAVAALESFYLESTSLSGEATAAVEVAFTAVAGYVASPGPLSESAYRPFSPGGFASAGFEVGEDGRIRSKVNTLAWELHANWWSPTTPGVGAGRWVRVTLLTGGPFTASASAAVGVWLSLSGSSLQWFLERSAVGTSSLTALVEVASDPDGLLIGSTFDVALDAEYAT